MLKSVLSAVVSAFILAGCTTYAQQQFDQDIEKYSKSDAWKLKRVEEAKPVEGLSGSSSSSPR